MRNHLGADPAQELHALGADGGGFHVHAAALQALQLIGDRAQHVRVQAATQPLVGRDHDHADALDFAFLHERVLELGVGRSQVRRNVAHLLGVGTGTAHPLLRLAHLGRGDHLHRLGDLARVLHALDLGSNLFRSGHIFLSIRTIAAPA
ncbi:hypothetical protein D3C72_1423960 [compost metagenome]